MPARRLLSQPFWAEGEVSQLPCPNATWVLNRWPVAARGHACWQRGKGSGSMCILGDTCLSELHQSAFLSLCGLHCRIKALQVRFWCQSRAACPVPDGSLQLQRWLPASFRPGTALAAGSLSAASQQQRIKNKNKKLRPLCTVALCSVSRQQRKHFPRTKHSPSCRSPGSSANTSPSQSTALVAGLPAAAQTFARTKHSPSCRCPGSSTKHFPHTVWPRAQAPSSSTHSSPLTAQPWLQAPSSTSAAPEAPETPPPPQPQSRSQSGSGCGAPRRQHCKSLQSLPVELHAGQAP